QLGHQVTPLVSNLAARHSNRPRAATTADLAHFEAVAAGQRLDVNRTQILDNRADMRRLRAKSDQLRMMAISVSLAAQHLLREERVTPQCHKAARVEVLGMKAPETHELDN